MTPARLIGENEASIPGNGRLDQSFPNKRRGGCSCPWLSGAFGGQGLAQELQGGGALGAGLIELNGTRPVGGAGGTSAGRTGGSRAGGGGHGKKGWKREWRPTERRGMQW